MNTLKVIFWFWPRSIVIQAAYTLLASISNGSVEQKKYMLLAAENGNLAGMVAYGQLLILEGERETGIRWILRGAEEGKKRGSYLLPFLIIMGQLLHWIMIKPHIGIAE